MDYLVDDEDTGCVGVAETLLTASDIWTNGVVVGGSGVDCGGGVGQ